MTILQIEAQVQQIAENPPQQPFELLYELLAAYNTPKATIARLKTGSHNLSKTEDEIAWKKKLFFKAALPGEDANALINALKTSQVVKKYDPRFIIVTDGAALLAFDTKTTDSLHTPVADLPQCFDFFLPLAGMEKALYQSENPADVRAAEKMGKLYDQITKDNPEGSSEATHDLNVFLSRLLFCFFAEDTGIFVEQGQFTLAIESHTQPDGADLSSYLDRLFEVLNTAENDRTELPNYLSAFPYVNGGLFRGQHPAPLFSRRSRQILLDCGGLSWAAINPDIFGSMIQAVVDPEQRGGLGMHYTSVPNIMKVIRPLFLGELLDEFQAAKGDKKRLRKLHHRICHIRVFDPACGSGNFLIIAYKELRLLEMLIFKELGEFLFSEISLDHFYGIELDDFAHEVAILSLWLAEHQMNQAFLVEFGRSKPALPLLASGNITHGNATRLDWKVVCPIPEDGGEVFVLGNPPYLGSFVQGKEQKEDLAYVAKGFTSYKDLDYIACWFILASNFASNNSTQFAFVTTNSICQGEQVLLLWPFIFSQNLEITFAYQSFKWGNNAKFNAGVYCTIIGVRQKSNLPKRLFFEDKVVTVNGISPYLTSGTVVIVGKKTKPLADIPTMNYGSKIVDNGHLIFSTEGKNALLKEHPEANPLFRKLVGSVEFIRGLERWCLFIKDEHLDLALSIKPIAERLRLVREFRLKSTEFSTRGMAEKPHKFYYSVHRDSDSVIIIPRVSSERRHYIPIGFLDSNTVISDLAFAVYDAAPWIFAILTSRIHMTWVRAVGGRLKMDYRYSGQLCYNTFPMPPLTPAQKTTLEKHVYQVLAEREQHSEKTLAELYDPEKMPEGLRRAHHELDLAVEECYRTKPFESDEERLEYLFKLYEKMLAEERARGTLFEGAEKAKKKKK